MCVEYEKRMADKRTDDHFIIAVDYARTNASTYVWSPRFQKLFPDEDRVRDGVPVRNDLVEIYKKKLLTPYNVNVVLHAMHAVAHRKSPPVLRWSMCYQIWCVEEIRVCNTTEHLTAHSQNHGSGVIVTYNGFKRAFERQYHSERAIPGGPRATSRDIVNENTDDIYHRHGLGESYNRPVDHGTMDSHYAYHLNLAQRLKKQHAEDRKNQRKDFVDDL